MVIELKEKGPDCGYCVHSKTNGWIAPCIRCDKWNEKELSIKPYMYYSDKYPGTTCEFFQGRNEYSSRDWG